MSFTEIQTRLRLADVLQQTGLSYSTLYRLMKSGEFPKSYRSPGRQPVYWAADEVADWLRVNQAAPVVQG